MSIPLRANTSRWLPWRVVRQLSAGSELVRAGRYGMIEVVDGEFHRLVLRPWPKVVSLPEVWWLGEAYHQRRVGDCCRVYYNQPRSCPNYLALKYVVTSHGATFASLRRAAQLLDQIACIKRSDAIVCEASNLRISERFLARWGWERHCLGSSRRHYIKRFYGQYPAAVYPAVTAD